MLVNWNIEAMNNIQVLVYISFILFIMAIHCQAGGGCHGGGQRCSYNEIYDTSERDNRRRHRGDCCSPYFCDQSNTPDVYTGCFGLDPRRLCYGVCRP